MHRQPAIYLLTNKPHGTLYTGVTSNLVKRIGEHKNKVIRGYSARYNLTRLVYFELFDEMCEAISREKQIKAGSRGKKLELIESINPEWKDLYRDICS
jgi:putative endonuclease